ncbi:MAG: hypothetical protein MI923_29480 [Phycisphaerales bacterium]|nr:hypothetical protein [Phycisphaerales bacterium]
MLKSPKKTTFDNTIDEIFPAGLSRMKAAARTSLLRCLVPLLDRLWPHDRLNDAWDRPDGAISLVSSTGGVNHHEMTHPDTVKTITGMMP